jgi:hypothetical protein
VFLGSIKEVEVVTNFEPEIFEGGSNAKGRTAAAEELMFWSFWQLDTEPLY